MEIRKTDAFARWLDGLRDIRARARILVRIERLAEGNPGDVRPIGEGVSELRIDYGPGYRVYFTKRGKALIVLLAGAKKASRPGTSGPPWPSHEAFRGQSDRGRYRRKQCQK